MTSSSSVSTGRRSCVSFPTLAGRRSTSAAGRAAPVASWRGSDTALRASTPPLPWRGSPARGGAGGWGRVAWGRAAHMPFAEGEFELAVAFMSLITVDVVAAAIHETAGVLAPGGCFCIATPHPLNRPEAAMRDYFREHRTAEPVERDGVRMVFEDAHRPLSDYTGALADAGFVIEHLGEPRLVEDGAPGTALEKAPRQPSSLPLPSPLPS